MPYLQVVASSGRRALVVTGKLPNLVSGNTSILSVLHRDSTLLVSSAHSTIP